MIFRATALSWVVAALCFTPTAFSVTNYADDFVDPAYILDFQYQTVTAKAQQIIVQWANALNLASPWSKWFPQFGYRWSEVAFIVGGWQTHSICRPPPTPPQPGSVTQTLSGVITDRFPGVTSKKYLAPSGDKHDYMSWRP